MKCLNFNRQEGNIFVIPAELPNSAKVQMRVRTWESVAKSIVMDTPLTPEPEPKPEPIVVKQHNPREILRGIQKRQAEANAVGYKKVKVSRKRTDLKALLDRVDALMGVRS